MTRFRFCLMGASQHPIVEVPVSGITEMHEMMMRTRFVEGRLRDADSEEERHVLLAVSRIQMVLEV